MCIYSDKFISLLFFKIYKNKIMKKIELKQKLIIYCSFDLHTRANTHLNIYTSHIFIYILLYIIKHKYNKIHIFIF